MVALVCFSCLVSIAGAQNGNVPVVCDKFYYYSIDFQYCTKIDTRGALSQWKEDKILRGRALVAGRNSNLTIEAFGHRPNCICFIDECEHVMNLFQILLMHGNL